MSPTTIWLIIVILFGVVEAVTTALVSVWFVIGGLAALLAAYLGASAWLQIVVFVVVSAIALVLTKPLVKKYFKKNVVPTNSDRLINAQARVTEDINNEESVGAVYVDGKTWSARSEDGSIIPKDTQVTVIRMEGVKLYVKA